MCVAKFSSSLALAAGALSILLAPTAGAAIANNVSDNGELFLVVYDDLAKVSYTKDLGITQNDFFVDAQQDGGAQFFWNFNPAGDEHWNTYTQNADLGNSRWAVIALETFGGNQTGKSRLFTTVKQGDEAAVFATDGSFTNQLFTFGIQASQAGQFFNSVNTTGTHGVIGAPLDYDVDGSSVNFETDSGKSYFGEPGGLSFNFNGNMTWSNSNAIGESSWFYYITRSGTDQLATPLVDEFDNLGLGTDGDGYFGFVYVDEATTPDSPYAGDWLLSYTIRAAPGFDAQSRAFAARIGRTESDGGFAVRALEGAAALGLESGAGFSRRLLGEAAVASAVPEPASFALMALGLAGLAAAARRKRGC